MSIGARGIIPYVSPVLVVKSSVEGECGEHMATGNETMAN